MGIGEAIKVWVKPRYDWNQLFRDWVFSGLPKSRFLESKGINPGHGSTIKATTHWLRAAKFLQEHGCDSLTEINFPEVYDLMMRADNVQPDFATTTERKPRPPKPDPITKQVEQEQEIYKGKPLNQAPEESIKAMIDAEIAAQEARIAEIERIRQSIFDFRRSQALSDYKMADNLKTHIKVCLNSAVQRYTDSSGVERVTTTLTTLQIRQLVNALAGVQKIQRLALGMSTENVGIEPTLNSALETSQTVDDNCPVFEVQVNKDGKFEKARPTQVA